MIVPPFTEETEAFRAAVREFVETELKPHVPEWEAAEYFPDEVFGWFAERGWLGVTMPKEYGGLGREQVFGGVMSEELSRAGSGGLVAGIGAHMGIACPPVARFGTDAQKQRWLVPALRAEKLAALAITEPGGGSDVASVRTKAERVDGGWLVNGEKTFITNGVRADFYVTAVKTTSEGGHGGMSFLVIEKGEGVSASALHKLGWHASDTGTVAFADVFVPEDHLLGELDKGFYLIMANFQGERLGMALGALGEMRASFEATVEWAAAQPPSPWRKYQIAELGLKVETSAAMAYGALRRACAGEDIVREVSMAKLLTQRANLEVQEGCLGLMGLEGADAELGLERSLRDSRLGPIGGGTDEIMKEIIGRSFGL
ncbi:MAG: acyl-CoA dehydrogenase [Solirubrobacteraceae bacterium]|nr:acyl-CoA dehydrogenase [Solirubrobacteraceae bacterium]